MSREKENSEATTTSQLLPYDLPYLTEGLRRRAQLELSEDDITRKASLKLLKSMLAEEKDLYWQDSDPWLLAFLRARKFDVSRTLSLVRSFYAVLRKHHELYGHFDFADVKRTFEENTMAFLPYRDDEGCVVFLGYSSNWNPHVNTMGDLSRAVTCALIHAIQSPCTQVAGFKIIFDFRDFTFSKLTHVSPTYLWLLAEALQNCFPARFRGAHIVNESYPFKFIWKVLKQLLTQKLRDRFHFHGKNVKELHKFFPPSILPAEYEGELPPFDNSKWAKSVEEYRTDISEVFTYGYGKQRK